jgi:hypothetical protein
MAFDATFKTQGMGLTSSSKGRSLPALSHKKKAESFLFFCHRNFDQRFL